MRFIIGFWAPTKDGIKRLNTILTDMCRDVWMYVSMESPGLLKPVSTVRGSGFRVQGSKRET